MRKLKTSHVWAFMGLQIIGTYIIGANWGTFNQTTALGFLVGTTMWTIFILSTLFDFVEKENEEIQSNNKET